MANPERGEVALVVAGRPYTLKLSMNAAAALEKRLGKRIGEVLADAWSLRFEAIRTMVWLLLQKHHADQFPTEEDAGNLIDDAGGVVAFFDALGELAAVNRSGEPEAGGSGGPNPPDAQDGTGNGSTSSASVSA